MNNQKENEKEKRGFYHASSKLGKQSSSKLRQHFNRGMTAFLVVAASVLFYFMILRLPVISDVLWKIFDVVKPVIYGLVIAYLLNPLVKRIESWFYPVMEDRVKSKEKARKISRAAGIFLALMLTVIALVMLLNMVIPELYRSIRDMVSTLPGQIGELVDKLDKIQTDETTTGIFLKNMINEGADMLENWLRTDLLRQTNILMSSLTVGVINILREIMNVLIGVIVSVYVLFSRELFLAQSRKCIYALLSAKHANIVLHLTRKSNEIFGGFIIGKIIDSLIIGILCFIGLSILDMPYSVLVSVIVGVTNVIPFFGPYIGAIPSAVLIILNEPIKGLYFIIFILVLQQLDGNVIGPKILGDSTGLSAFWVVFSILLGGGLFGFVGMVMGVPTFAVIYYIVDTWLNRRLEVKKLPANTSSYQKDGHVTDEGIYVKELQERKGE